MTNFEKNLIELNVGEHFALGDEYYRCVPGGWLYMDNRDGLSSCCFIPRPIVSPAIRGGNGEAEVSWQPIRTLTQNEGAVLLYAPQWIDEDFNPHGVREGFRSENDDGPIIAARWNDPCDRWETDEGVEPLLWAKMPSPAREA